MGIIIVWGWDLVFYYLFLTRLVRCLDMYTLYNIEIQFCYVMYMINIKELQLPNPSYVGQHLEKRTRNLFASFMDVKKLWFHFTYMCP